MYRVPIVHQFVGAMASINQISSPSRLIHFSGGDTDNLHRNKEMQSVISGPGTQRKKKVQQDNVTWRFSELKADVESSGGGSLGR